VTLSVSAELSATFDLPECGEVDEELQLTVGARRATLRRVHCAVADGLLRHGDAHWPLPPQARAALLWLAFRRYSEVVALNRISGGLSGGAVFVVRPRLRAPDFAPADLMASAGPPEVLEAAWGSPLLVKFGPERDIRQEWDRSEVFLRDRQSPFVARNVDMLNVGAEGPWDPGRPNDPHATLISSFLGGELVQVERLDSLIRGASDPGAALRAIDSVVAHLATWHTNPRPHTFAMWPRAFRFAGNLPPAGWPANQPGAPWLAFGQYNFRKRNTGEVEEWDLPQADHAPPGDPKPSYGRAQFADGVRWDIPFGSTPHLEGHLLGSRERRDGLLYRIAHLPALFSLVHGDLNPRNVLCDAGKVWLIDFSHVGVGPILADLARLEVNLRLWCIELLPAAVGTAEAARALEFLLLDQFHRSDGGLEPVRKLARQLGANPDDLEKIARCVIHIRRLARRWCLPDFSDGRDYLAALYLTVLGLTRHAGRGHAGPVNERWVMEMYWVLEETLDRLFGRQPYDRDRRPYEPIFHVSAELVRDPHAPRRVDYICSTADGREALQPVEALRGVLQGSYHHLDAYQHSLSVLAYAEALLENPVEGLLRPRLLDAAVAGTLRGYGLSIPPASACQANPPDVEAPWFPSKRAAVEKWLAETLDPDAVLLLKWCALLHDVGKPGTRVLRRRGGTPEVQFHGHERYGARLLQSRLVAWFSDPVEGVSRVGLRLEQLIHDHHHSHQLVRDLSEPGKSAELFDLARGDPASAMWKWSPGAQPDLPLLLLHGYADRLAARGVRQGGTVTRWGEITLALLTHLACGQSARAVREAMIHAACVRAQELLAQGCFPARQMNRATGILRGACAESNVAPEQFLEFLRNTISSDELRSRLKN
jgi:hypothetical protein